MRRQRLTQLLKERAQLLSAKPLLPKLSRVSWYKNSRELTNQNKTRKGHLYASVLTVSDLNASDSGIYQCRVQEQLNRFLSLDKTGYFPAEVELIVKRKF